MPAIKRPVANIERMLEQTLVPSPHVIELRLDPLGSAASRFSNANGSPGERAHGASRLYGFNELAIIGDQNTSAVIRDWYLSTGNDGAAELMRLGSHQVRDLESLPPMVAQCLAPYTETSPLLAPLFACDIVVSADGALWRLVPGTTKLTFEGKFSTSDAQAVAGALEGWPPVEPSLAQFMFVVGAFARAGYLFGERAHRHTYVQSGRVGGMIEARWFAQQRANEILVSTDVFFDERVEEPLRCDGVERAVLLALAACPLGQEEPQTEGLQTNGEEK